MVNNSSFNGAGDFSKGAALLCKHHCLSVHVTTIVTESGAVAVKHTATTPIAQPKPAKHGKKR